MVPDVKNSKWRDLVTGKNQYEFKSLGTKILMGRVLLAIKHNPGEDTIQKCISEVHDYFMKNERSAESDLKTIFK